MVAGTKHWFGSGTHTGLPTLRCAAPPLWVAFERKKSPKLNCFASFGEGEASELRIVHTRACRPRHDSSHTHAAFTVVIFYLQLLYQLPLFLHGKLRYQIVP